MEREEIEHDRRGWCLSFGESGSSETESLETVDDRHNGRRARGSPGSLAWRIISDPPGDLPPLLFLLSLFFPSNERNARTRSTTTARGSSWTETATELDAARPRNLRFVVPSRWLETYPPSKHRRNVPRPSSDYQPYIAENAPSNPTVLCAKRSFIPRWRKILRYSRPSSTNGKRTSYESTEVVRWEIFFEFSVSGQKRRKREEEKWFSTMVENDPARPAIVTKTRAGRGTNFTPKNARIKDKGR